MSRRETREILAAHANRLQTPAASMDKRLTRNDQVQGLLELAEQVQRILVPVEPDVSFRRRLHGDLILEAQQREAEPRGNRLGASWISRQIALALRSYWAKAHSPDVKDGKREESKARSEEETRKDSFWYTLEPPWSRLGEI